MWCGCRDGSANGQWQPDRCGIKDKRLEASNCVPVTTVRQPPLGVDFEPRLVTALESVLPRILDVALAEHLGFSARHAMPHEPPRTSGVDRSFMLELSGHDVSGRPFKPFDDFMRPPDSNEALASLLRDTLRDATAVAESLRATAFFGAKAPAATTGASRRPRSATEGATPGEARDPSPHREINSARSRTIITEPSDDRCSQSQPGVLEAHGSFHRSDSAHKSRYSVRMEEEIVLKRQKLSQRVKGCCPAPLAMHGEGWRPRLVRAVHSPYFDLVVTVLIIANSFNTGLQMNNEALFEAERVHRLARGEGPGTTDTWLTTTLNQVLTLLYAAEVLLRLFTDRSLFFFGPSQQWNIFDAFLVIAALTETFYPDSGRLAFARTFRVFRMLRVLRVLRLIRIFDTLRQMVMSVMNSFLSLFWVSILLFVLLYMFGLYYLQVTVSFFREIDPVLHEASLGCLDALHPSQETCYSLAGDLELYWGSLQSAMLSLFWSVTGGKDWADLFGPLFEVWPGHGVVYVFFIIFVLLGVLNVVTGIFVDQAMKIAEQDRDMVVNRAVEDTNHHTKELRRFFKVVDRDGNGAVSYDEFREGLQNKKVHAHFRHLGLDVNNVRSVYALLDEDGAGEVTSDQFVAGVMRLRGAAKGVDLCKVLMAVQDMYPMLERLCERVSSNEEPRFANGYDRADHSPREIQFSEDTQLTSDYTGASFAEL